MSGRSPRWFSGIKYPYADRFPDNTWAQIIDACQKRRVPKTWMVKNQKAMTIGGTDYLIDIIGKEHDDYADGTGKAPLTFQLHDVYATKLKMNDSASNVGGWAGSDMRTTTLPALLAQTPLEVQNAIREVAKRTSIGNQSATVSTTADKLFLLSEIEIFGSIKYSGSGEGSQYAYYAAGDSSVKYTGGSAGVWWERSPRGDSASRFCYVGVDGTARNGTANNTSYAAFAFCF